jgi:flavin prenyltransferase
VYHRSHDVTSIISSGSFQTMGMIVAPCSMRTLAEIAHGIGSNLLTRAADVVLKERRRLILLTRETPLHLGHLNNMVQVTQMGGIIFPPVPAFYHHPQTIEDIVMDHVGRVLDLFEIEHQLTARWCGWSPQSSKSDG